MDDIAGKLYHLFRKAQSVLLYHVLRSVLCSQVACIEFNFSIWWNIYIRDSESVSVKSIFLHCIFVTHVSFQNKPA